jgi:malonyl CoA-acyl carrier protein transacylase/phosphopantetheinyl transferase
MTRQSSIAAVPRRDSQVFVLRGEDRNELLGRVRHLSDEIAAGGVEGRLSALASTLNGALTPGGVRLAIVAGSLEELQTRLARAAARLADQSCRQIRDATGIYFSAEPLGHVGKVALLFPGEGAQYLGMLGGLAEHFPYLNAIFDHCDASAANYAHDKRPVSRFMRNPAGLSSGERERLEKDLRQIDNAMLSVFMANWAMFEVLQRLGVQAHAVAGHSAGELAALAAAGVFAPRQQLHLLGSTMQALVGRGDSAFRLLAVAAPREQLAELIEAAAAGDASFQACVAMDNCPHQSIAVGDAASVEKIEGQASQRGLLCERLDLGRPYHTPWFEPYMGPLRQLFAAVEFYPPRLPVYSCTTARLFPSRPEEMRELALDHWRSPVEFTALVRQLHRDGVRVFVEVGPRNNLTSFVDDILRTEPHLAAASNVPHRSAFVQLCHLAAELVAHHVPVRLEALNDNAEAGVSNSRLAAEKPSAPAATDPPGRPHVATAAGSVQRDHRSAPRNRSAAGLVMQRHFALANEFLKVQTQVMQQFLRKGRQPVAAAKNSPATPPAPCSTPPAAEPHPSHRPTSFPLLGQILENERGKKLSARRVLNLEEDAYADHHTVGGRSISQVDPRQHGLPIMPMTFTLEMMIEAASALLPDLVVLAVKNVRLSRWLAFFEGDPVSIQLSATVLDGAPRGQPAEARREVLVEVKDLGRASEGKGAKAFVAAVGTVVLGDGYPAPPEAGEFRLTNQRPCRTDVPTTYNNLFHGELLQGFQSIERFGAEGIEGVVRTLPRSELFRSVDDPRFVGDPVLLDVAMHPAVAWHLEQPDQSGRIMLPFELKRLELYGPTPAEGALFRSRTRIVEETHWHYTHVTELYDDSGRMWAKIDGIKLWRFYLPFHDVNFHGPKDVYFLAEEWPEAATRLAAGLGAGPDSFCCVRLKELNDLKQPALQLVASRVMLSPAELEQFLALRRPDDKKAEWLFGRAAAKDAVRLLQRKRHGERPFMADVEILSDQSGRPAARPRGQQLPADYPIVSIAHAAGHVAAIASTTRRIGIDIEPVVPRDAGFEAIAFDDQERELLAGLPDRNEWIARFWCAKEAVGKALGCGLAGGPRTLAVHGASPDSGRIEVALGDALAQEFSEFRNSLIHVLTWREADLVAAATFGEPAPNRDAQDASFAERRHAEPTAGIA